jgi:hypothetical protein
LDKDVEMGRLQNFIIGIVAVVVNEAELNHVGHISIMEKAVKYHD